MVGPPANGSSPDPAITTVTGTDIAVAGTPTDADSGSAPASTGSSSPLAKTGANPLGALLVGVLLLGAGLGATLLVARRRRSVR
ncbi:hypothetical protein [Arthrobacter sp. MA-N2]|uniref:hypothetical protein n=1 Tax=Arthrobacter sp. MA-N2 TaxID=1101188 RepID=UPI0004846705|nr:hypothetical protein [Arthrobacter sp. MA-N2]